MSVEGWRGILNNDRIAGTIPDLITVLRCDGHLRTHDDQLVAEVTRDVHADKQPRLDTESNAAVWLHRQLATGERRSRELAFAAARDGIGWRSLEGVKRRAGVSAARHDRASWWSLVTPTPPTPPSHSQPSVTMKAHD